MIYGNTVLSQECKSRLKKKPNSCVREFRFKLGLYGLGKTHKLRNLALLGQGSAFQNLKALKQR